LCIKIADEYGERDEDNELTGDAVDMKEWEEEEDCED